MAGEEGNLMSREYGSRRLRARECASVRVCACASGEDPCSSGLPEGEPTMQIAGRNSEADGVDAWSARRPAESSKVARVFGSSKCKRLGPAKCWAVGTEACTNAHCTESHETDPRRPHE